MLRNLGRLLMGEEYLKKAAIAMYFAELDSHTNVQKVRKSNLTNYCWLAVPCLARVCS